MASGAICRTCCAGGRDGGRVPALPGWLPSPATSSRTLEVAPTTVRASERSEASRSARQCPARGTRSGPLGPIAPTRSICSPTRTRTGCHGWCPCVTLAWRNRRSRSTGIGGHHGCRSGQDARHRCPSQVCGHAHLGNFGTFASPERRQVFDVNDFDETLPGPWEWDVKRRAAIMVIAARDNECPDDVGRSTARRTVQAYCDAMADSARAPWAHRLR